MTNLTGYAPNSIGYAPYPQPKALSQVGFALRTSTQPAQETTQNQTVITPRTKRVIKIISCSREHMYKVFTSEQLHILTRHVCIYIYTYIYIHVTHRRKYKVQHDASEKCTTKQTLFSAKSGECHVFPLPIGLREWLKRKDNSRALFVCGGWVGTKTTQERR